MVQSLMHVAETTLTDCSPGNNSAMTQAERQFELSANTIHMVSITQLFAAWHLSDALDSWFVPFWITLMLKRFSCH